MPPGRILSLTGYYSFVLLGWNNVLVPSLIQSIEHGFHQSDAAYGLLYFAKSLLYACGAFSSGLLTERLGRKAVLAAGALTPALFLCAASLAPTWVVFIAVNAPVSWGSGVIDAGVNALFLDLYRDARGSALNFLHLFFSVGALVGPSVIGLLVATGAGWRTLYLITAAGFVLLLVSLLPAGMPSGLRGAASPLAAAQGGATAMERSLLPFIGLALSIGLYTAAEIGVSSWVVKLLVASPLIAATGALSLFWGGLTLGRLLSKWVAERLDYYVFTVGCFLLASLALAGAVLTAPLPLRLGLFALSGLFYGPIYPMIMALGGNFYPHRLAALSGSLTTAGSIGVIIYPPLMGVMAARIGLRNGMLGAALLGLPAVLTILATRALGRRAA